MIYDWAPQGLGFAREKHRGCCTDIHFCKAQPSPMIQVAEFYSGWKLKEKDVNFAGFVREKNQVVGTDLPPSLNARGQGRLGSYVCLVESTSDPHFLSSSASSCSARLREHPLPPSWSQAVMAHCAMLSRHDCFFPSQWWLHINRGLMSLLRITYCS